jgi:phosphate acetyltransferase
MRKEVSIMGFIDSIIEKARSDRKKIVLPESYDPRVVEAAAKIMQKDIADVVLLGDRAKIQAAAPSWDVSGATVIDPAASEYYESLYEAFTRCARLRA